MCLVPKILHPCILAFKNRHPHKGNRGVYNNIIYILYYNKKITRRY